MHCYTVSSLYNVGGGNCKFDKFMISHICLTDQYQLLPFSFMLLIQCNVLHLSLSVQMLNEILDAPGPSEVQPSEHDEPSLPESETDVTEEHSLLHSSVPVQTDKAEVENKSFQAYVRSVILCLCLIPFSLIQFLVVITRASSTQ